MTCDDMLPPTGDGVARVLGGALRAMGRQGLGAGLTLISSW